MLYEAGPSSQGGPTESIYSFLDLLLQLIAQKQESYIKDTVHFINFIENTAPLEAAILATLDVCSLYTNIPQEEGIEIVCRFYEEHYQPTLFVPTQFLGDLMLLILTKKFIQIQRQTLPTDTWHSNWHLLQMAVALAVIFMAHIEKQTIALEEIY